LCVHASYILAGVVLVGFLFNCYQHIVIYHYTKCLTFICSVWFQLLLLVIGTFRKDVCLAKIVPVVQEKSCLTCGHLWAFI